MEKPVYIYIGLFFFLAQLVAAQPVSHDDRSAVLSTSIDSLRNEIVILDSLRLDSKQEGEFKRSLIYLQEQIQSKENLNGLLLKRERNTADKKMNEDSRIIQAEAETEITQWRRMALGIGSILLLPLLYYLYSNLNDTKRYTDELNVVNMRFRETQKNLAEKNNELSKYIEDNVRLTQFAQLASHDLKSPMRLVSSFSSLLKKTYLPKSDASEIRFLNFIESESKKIDETLVDLFNYSKVNSQVLSRADFSVDELISEILLSLSSTISSYGSKVDYIESGLILNADRNKLKRVVQNIIQNALKFSKNESHPLVKIGALSDNQQVVISIEDNGIGMNEEVVKTIFQPFNRLYSREYEGTGLGLSISQGIVKKHGGRIEVSSTLGNGSRFDVILPTVSDTSSPESEVFPVFGISSRY